MSVDSGGLQANTTSDYPSISSDGRFVVFESDATNLISTNLAWHTDAFIRDRMAGKTYLASVPNGGGMPLGSSYRPVISPNGRFVTFNRVATNVVAGDNNGE